MMGKFVRAEFICEEDFKPGCCSICPVAEYDWDSGNHRCPFGYDYYDCKLVIVNENSEEE